MSKSKKPPKTATLTEQLRWYLKNCGMSNLQIAHKTGIHHGVLSRFRREERGMSLDTLDTLAKYLRVRLVQDDARSA